MGEHHTNEQALAAKTFPKFPPHGRVAAPALGFSVVPKPNIYVISPGRNVDEKDQAAHAEFCTKNDLVQEVHVLGNPLAPEKCDVVLGMAVEYANPAMAGPRGVPAGRLILPGMLGRFDYQNFVGSCEQALPGLVLVP